MDSGKSQGRPPSYSPKQLTDAIGALEERNEDVSTESVKRHLVECLGISANLNSASLARAIERALADRKEAREAALIDTLGATGRKQIEELFESLTRPMQLFSASLQQEIRKDGEVSRTSLEERVTRLLEENETLKGKLDEIAEEYEELAHRASSLEETLDQKEETIVSLQQAFKEQEARLEEQRALTTMLVSDRPNRKSQT